MDEKLSQSDLLLTQLLEAIVEGVLAFDRDYCYIAWNKGMERITGLKREDVLGKCAFDVFPFLKETGEDKCLQAALVGQSTTSENRPYVVPETGRAGFFKAYYSPLREGDTLVQTDLAATLSARDRKSVVYGKSV